MDIWMSDSVYVQVMQTASGFLTHSNSLRRSSTKRTQVRLQWEEEGGKEIFIIPKESVSDLEQLNWLLISLAVVGGEEKGTKMR